ERQYTGHGVVIGLDRQRNLAYALRWSGSEPGGAAELSALRLNQATTLTEFSQALSSWRMPAVDVIATNRDNDIRQQRAALQPRRRGFDGRYPVDGRGAANEWRGWVSHPSEGSGWDAAAVSNDDPFRTSRISSLLWPGHQRSAKVFAVDTLAELQRDVHADDADVMIAGIERIVDLAPGLSEARRRLIAWDRNMRADSQDAQLFDEWRRQFQRRMAGATGSPALADELAARVDYVRVLMSQDGGLTAAIVPTNVPQALAQSLTTALDVVQGSDANARWSVEHRVSFEHPLALSDEAKRRFNVGPFPADGAEHTVQALADRGRTGAGFRAVFDAGDWDRAQVVSAPGQSGWPDSAHYRDMAALWAAGRMIPLPFSAAAVQRAAKATLTLQPR
ncbi:MAG: penicillin acylase family protein, partial [Vicinamibacterales bacterium]